MGSLEHIVRGAGVGFMKPLDPLGVIINTLDSDLTAAGHSEERAVKTGNSRAYSTAFSSPEEQLPTKGAYVARTGGMVAGGALGATALYAAVTAGGLAAVAAGTAMLGLGAYSALKTIGKYWHDLRKGEKIDGNYQKASLWQGMKAGYHTITNPIVRAYQGIETALTGRGLGSSHVESSITKSHSPLRRNTMSMAGKLAGEAGTLGGIYTLAALTAPTPVFVGTGLLIAYKTIRDFVKTHKVVKGNGTPVDRPQPKYINPIPA